jgi:hypothetical protein
VPGIDKNRQDFTIYSGGWAVGRIYETRGGPDHLRWSWSLTVDPPMARSDRVPTLEEAKTQFHQKSWPGRRGRRCGKCRSPVVPSEPTARSCYVTALERTFSCRIPSLTSSSARTISARSSWSENVAGHSSSSLRTRYS